MPHVVPGHQLSQQPVSKQAVRDPDPCLAHSRIYHKSANPQETNLSLKYLQFHDTHPLCHPDLIILTPSDKPRHPDYVRLTSSDRPRHTDHLR